jgi:hypothetical protein
MRVWRFTKMVAPNEFWLQLHRLAATYDAEGLNATERAENIVAELRDMSHLARRELVAELLRLTVRIPAIYSLVIADQRKANRSKPRLCRSARQFVRQLND